MNSKNRETKQIVIETAKNMRGKIILLLLTIGLYINCLHAQNLKIDSIANKLQHYYNSNNYDAFYELFSNEMQHVLSLETTNQFLSNLKDKEGNIVNTRIIKQSESTSIAFYKITFERSNLALMVAINEQNKIDELLFKPYHNRSKSKLKMDKYNGLKNLPQRQISAIVEYMEDFPDNTQLAIALIKDGITNFYGIVKENNTLKKVENENKIFEIGSISKVFTATLLANAVIEHKIKLDDKINKFYNFTFKDNIGFSFKSLSNHTSGLPTLPSNLNALNYLELSTQESFPNPYKEYRQDNLYSYFQKDLDSSYLSDKQYKYSNLGVGILGHTLSLVENKDFEDLLKEKIFRKYGMTNSYTNISQVKEDIICGLDDDGNMISNWIWDSDVLLGAGGILSTVDDLSKFANAQFDNTNIELSLTRVPTFTLNNKIEVALGWHIIKSEDNKELYWHNGATGGYSSSMVLDINNRFGVIILSNVSAYSLNKGNIDNLSFELIKLLEE